MPLLLLCLFCLFCLTAPLPPHPPLLNLLSCFPPLLFIPSNSFPPSNVLSCSSRGSYILLEHPTLLPYVSHCFLTFCSFCRPPIPTPLSSPLGPHVFFIFLTCRSFYQLLPHPAHSLSVTCLNLFSSLLHLSRSLADR